MLYSRNRPRRILLDEEDSDGVARLQVNHLIA